MSPPGYRPRQYDGSPHCEYWFLLGQFMHAFALAEVTMLTALRRFSGLPKQVAASLWANLKIKESIESVRRVLVDSEDLRRISDALDQIGHINDARNKIVHRGAMSDDERIIVTNRYIRRPSAPTDEIEVSPELLIALIADTERAEIIILNEINARYRIGLPQIVEAHQQAMQRPWLYKPPQPTNGLAKPPKPLRALKVQPQPSPQSPEPQE